MFHEGQQLGEYMLTEKLGRGGFGEVWLAENDEELFAIKFPHKDQVDWKLITQEIGLWTLCGKHPNVMPLVGAKNFNGQIAIISEYAPDGSLEDLLREKEKLPIEEAVEIALGILEGLQHLHENGIIHRDLKPANILLDRKTPRLTDFGISRIVTTDSRSETIAGTWAYMAPECFDGKRNVQTDIWAVGVILYRMLTGNLPFSQKEQTALIGSIIMNEPKLFLNYVHKELWEIIRVTLSKSPTIRYQSSTELKKSLQSFSDFYFSSNRKLSLSKAVNFFFEQEKIEKSIRLERVKWYIANKVKSEEPLFLLKENSLVKLNKDISYELLNEILPYAAQTEIQKRMSGGYLINNKYLKVDEYDAEIIRRLLAEIYFQNNGVEKGELSFDVISLNISLVRSIVEFGRTFEGLDYIPKEFFDLLKNLEDLANLSNTSCTIYLCHEALVRQNFHQQSLLGAKNKELENRYYNLNELLENSSDEALIFQKAYKNWQNREKDKTIRHYFSNLEENANQSLPIGAENIFANIITNRWKDLGLSSLTEAAKLSVELIYRYAKARQKENSNLTFEEILNTFDEI